MFFRRETPPLSIVSDRRPNTSPPEHVRLAVLAKTRIEAAGMSILLTLARPNVGDRDYRGELSRKHKGWLGKVRFSVREQGIFLFLHSDSERYRFTLDEKGVANLVAQILKDDNPIDPGGKKLEAKTAA